MRRICVVTGTRAEYGLLYWLLRELAEAEDVALQLVVTGAHLSGEFGATGSAVSRDGFVIEDQVDMLLSSDTPVGIAKSIGLGIIGFSDVFRRLAPDLLVLLGDRYEAMAAAQAAMVARIPIAHIHGGETTEGLIDEAIRHSITKMSHLHFVAADEYARRVKQLGEHPSRIFQVGAVGLDHIPNLQPMGRSELAESLGTTVGDIVFLVTYHPVTLEDASSEEKFKQLLAALEMYPTATVIITGANADTDGRVVSRCASAYAAERRGRVVFEKSLGHRRYLSAMKLANSIVGNSSSGLIEAPAMGVPTVNVGLRQAGRLCADSVISCGETTREIKEAIDRTLEPGFRSIAARRVTPYGVPGASKKIAEVLRTHQIEGIMFKKFHDLLVQD